MIFELRRLVIHEYLKESVYYFVEKVMKVV